MSNWALQIICELIMPDSPEHNDDNVEKAAPRRERPSERMFRRSQAAEQRRRQSERKDAAFMRMVFGIAGVTTLIVFMVVYMFSVGM